MSSLRKVLSSRANGALSPGPSTPEAKRISSQNALYHGLFARCVVLESESREAFDTLMGQHLDRLKPFDGVELGMVEEMVAAHWRLRRAWAMETRILDNAIAGQTEPQSGADPADPADAADAVLDCMAKAIASPAAAASITLMYRYETRLHLMYQRALHNLLLLRAADQRYPRVQNDPSPICEHSGETLLLPAPADGPK